MSSSTSKHSIPLEKLLSTKRDLLPKGIRYVTGGSIFNPQTPSKLLILKRAATDVFPGYWEVPGGSIEAGETVREGLAREIFEETGLVLESVVCRLGDNEFEGRDSTGKVTRWVQFHFFVTVQVPVVVKLDPKEHEEWVWAGEEDVRGLLRLPGQVKVMEEAFRVVRERGLGRGGRL